MKILGRVGLALVFLVSSVAAQELSGVLTLPAAARLLTRQNLTLQQQQRRIEQAQAAIGEKQADLLPSLSLNGSYNYVSELARFQVPIAFPGIKPIEVQAGVKNQYDLHADIRQPLFTGFRLRSAVKAARAGLMRSRAQQQVLQNQLLLQVHRLYYAMQLNQLQQRALRASAERTAGQLRTVRNLLAQGQATRFDTLRVANQLLALRTSRVQLKHRLEILKARMAALLNVPQIDSVQTFVAGDGEGPVLPLGEYVKRARQNRPELAALAGQKDQLRFGRRMARSQYFPQVFAGFSYHYARPGVNFFKDEWMNYYAVGVNLRWDLWNWGKTRRQVRQSSLGLRIADLEKQKLLLRIRREVTEAYRNLLNDRDQIRLNKQLVAQERERYRIIRAKYQQGLASTLDVTDAETALTRAELALQQATINRRIHHAQMRYATGQISETGDGK